MGIAKAETRGEGGESVAVVERGVGRKGWEGGW